MFKEREVSKYEPALAFFGYFGAIVAVQKFGLVPTISPGVAIFLILLFVGFALGRYWNAIFK